MVAREVAVMVEERWQPWWRRGGSYGGRKLAVMVEGRWQLWWKRGGSHGGREVAVMVEERWQLWWKQCGNKLFSETLQTLFEKCRRTFSYYAYRVVIGLRWAGHMAF
jgi:hypothetical protein